MGIKCKPIKEIRTLFNRFWTKLGKKSRICLLVIYCIVTAISPFGGLFFYFTEVPVVDP